MNRLDPRSDDERLVADLRRMRQPTPIEEAPPELLGGILDRIRAEDPRTSRHHDITVGPKVVPISRRPWRLPAIGAVAASLALLAGVAVVMLGDDDTDTEIVAALDVLEPGLTDVSGSATLTDGDDGTVLVVDAELDAPEGTELELWLLEVDDDGVQGLQSIGVYDGPGTYDVPADVDTGAFSVVDISVEPLDGDPSHSGRSVVRGELTA